MAIEQETRLVLTGDRVINNYSSDIVAVNGGFLRLGGGNAVPLGITGDVRGETSTFAGGLFGQGAEDVVASSMVDGGAVVAWTETGRDAGGSNVYARLLDADGAPTSPILTIFVGEGDQQVKDVAGLAGGGFAVHWDAKVQVFDAAGTAVTEHADAYLLRGSSTGIPGEGLVALSDGGFVVYDPADARGETVRLKRFSATGEELSQSTVSLDDEELQQTSVILTALADDRFLSGGPGSLSGGIDVRDADGALLSQSAPIPGVPSRSVSDKSVISLSDGGALMSFAALNDETGERVYERWMIRFDAQGEVTRTFVLDDVNSTRLIPVEVAEGQIGLFWSQSGASSPTDGRFQLLEENFAPTGAVTIEGVAAQFEPLRAVTSVEDPDGIPDGAEGFIWLRDGEVIEGAEEQIYVLTQDDVGAAISVRMDYRDAAGGNEIVTSEQTTVVVDQNDLPTGALEADRPVTEQIYSYALSDGRTLSISTWTAYSDSANADFIEVTLTLRDADGEWISRIEIADAIRSDNEDTGPFWNAQTLLNGDWLIALGDVALRIDTQGEIVSQLYGGDPQSTSAGQPIELDDGRLVLTWTSAITIRVSASVRDSLDQGADVYARVFGTDGLPDSEIFRLNPLAAENQRAPDLAELSDGTLVAIWRDGDDEIGYDIYARLFDTAGQALTDQIRVDDDASQSQDESPQVTALPGGGFRVSWTGGDNVFERTFDREGVPLAPGAAIDADAPLRIVAGELVEANLSLLVDADGLPETFDYQWLRNGAEISGATAATYRTVAADLGADLALRVNYTDLAGTEEAFTSSVGLSIVYALTPTLIQGTDAGERLEGFLGNETIVAFDGDDTLIGKGGDDVLRGGTGADVMNGGPGSDTFFVDNPGDTVIELGGWDGRDLVGTSISFDMSGADIEDGLIIGDADGVVLTGNALDNALTGGVSGRNDVLRGMQGNDTLSGEAGDDVLDGGAGADLLIGGQGSDRFIVDDAGDVVVESRSWAGSDTVEASVDFRMGTKHIEDLVLTGDARLGAGNGLMNEIRGNSVDNVLDGGKNNDTLMGGAGNDTYLVRAPGDLVVEAAGRGDADVVLAFRAYALTANVERLYLQTLRNDAGEGVTGVNGIGNNLDNLIVGNPFDNVIAGREGSDTLKGQAGADTFVFDRQYGAGNVDRIIDFNATSEDEGDSLLFKQAVFQGVEKGALADSQFVEGRSALDSDDRFIFDADSGALWFDIDGSGGTGQQLIATFEQNAVVTFEDITLF